MKTLMLIDCLNTYTNKQELDYEEKFDETFDAIVNYIRNTDDIHEVIFYKPEDDSEIDNRLINVCKRRGLYYKVVLREPKEKTPFDYSHHVDNKLVFKSAIDYAVMHGKQLVIGGIFDENFLKKMFDVLLKVMDNDSIFINVNCCESPTDKTKVLTYIKNNSIQII